MSKLLLKEEEEEEWWWEEEENKQTLNEWCIGVRMMSYYYLWIIMTKQPIREQQLTAANGKQANRRTRLMRHLWWGVANPNDSMCQTDWNTIGLENVWCQTTKARGNKPKELMMSWVQNSVMDAENRGAWGKPRWSWVRCAKGPQERCREGATVTEGLVD